jgi:hypothetical protein
MKHYLGLLVAHWLMYHFPGFFELSHLSVYLAAEFAAGASRAGHQPLQKATAQQEELALLSMLRNDFRRGLLKNELLSLPSSKPVAVGYPTLKPKLEEVGLGLHLGGLRSGDCHKPKLPHNLFKKKDIP